MKSKIKSFDLWLYIAVYSAALFSATR
jgi:hypothetical protein